MSGPQPDLAALVSLVDEHDDGLDKPTLCAALGLTDEEATALARKAHAAQLAYLHRGRLWSTKPF